MTVVKTAVSIEKDVLADAQRLADALHVSRSQLVTIALRRMVRAHENKALLAQLNTSVDDMTNDETAEEQAVLSLMKRHMAHVERDLLAPI